VPLPVGHRANWSCRRTGRRRRSRAALGCPPATPYPKTGAGALRLTPARTRDRAPRARFTSIRRPYGYSAYGVDVAPAHPRVASGSSRGSTGTPRRPRPTDRRESAHGRVGRTPRHHRLRCNPRAPFPRRVRSDTTPTPRGGNGPSGPPIDASDQPSS
jgi:hypothetical protein